MKTESKYKLIVENTTDLISVLDFDGVLHYSSSSYQSGLGYDIEKHKENSLFSVISPDDLPRVKETLNEIRKSNQSKIIEFQCLNHKQLECNFKPIVEENGISEYIVAVCLDVTERKKTENALIEMEAKYRSLVEDSSVGVYITQNGILQYVNPRFAELYGYEQDEIIGTEVLSHIVPEKRQFAAEVIRRRLNGEFISPFNLQIIRKDQRLVDVEIHGALLSIYNGKPATTGTVVDITERIKAEEAYRNSEKLAIVGELAAGIGHEIRNPLTAIKGFLQILDLSKPKNKEYREFILAEIDRINLIVTEFMYLAKPQARSYEKHSVETILNEVINLLDSYAVLHNIQIISELHSIKSDILCDKNQIKQVFVNIIKNAIESMSDGGTIVVSLKDQNDSLIIQVIDEGFGIPKDKIPKLGEPFYTTKEKGTGLGLMICFKIVDYHEGKMKIESVEGEGTKVEIIFPILNH